MADDQHLERIVEMLTVTAEVMGQQVTPAALVTMADDLSCHSLSEISSALTRCRRECRGRITLADIIDRLDAVDGRLSGDEAWARVVESRDESLTIVWTDEIEEASGAAWPILQIGDKVGARMAFLRAYDRIVREHREIGVLPRARVSLGHDRDGREPVISAAIKAGLLTHEEARRYLPSLPPTGAGADIAGLLTGKVVAHPALTAARLTELRATLAGATRSKTVAEKDRERQAEIEARRREMLATVHGMGVVLPDDQS